MRASPPQIDAVRDAMKAAPLSEVERAKIESRISQGMTSIEAFDIRISLLRYGAAHKDMRIMLELEP